MKTSNVLLSYSKAGLAGRSELSAFFLKGLLVPAEIENTKASGGPKRQST
jgi:hypothetical protein